MKTVILDGSNIIRSMYNVSRGFDFAKEEVLANSLVKTMEYLKEGDFECGEDIYRVEVYFDGPTREVYRPNELVEVFFSKRKKADELIVNSVYENADTYGNEVLVITRDKGLRDLCEEYGARVMHTGDFLWKCRYLIDGFAVADREEVEKADKEAFGRVNASEYV